MSRKTPRKYTHKDQRQRHLAKVQRKKEARLLAEDETGNNRLSVRFQRRIGEIFESTLGRASTLRKLIVTHISEIRGREANVEFSLPVPETQSLATPDLERSIRGNFRLEKVRILMARGDGMAINAEAAYLRSQELTGFGNALILGTRDWGNAAVAQLKRETPNGSSRERRG